MRLYSIAVVPFLAAITVQGCNERVKFWVEPTSGPRPLAVVCAADDTLDEGLPEGIYLWRFDGIEDAGPAETHGQRTHVFDTPGMHTIALSVEVPTSGYPIACKYGETGEPEATIIVWPRLSGIVRQESGSPIAGVTVTADNGGTSGVTDAEGQYHVDVPYDWSGTVAPESGGYTFDPNARSYSSVQADA
ncbi:MAG: carboxypeptidase regulatory-like domain-containing protein, partial [Phycisphaerae bacterium]|nr:carboxypeptidase regulatory-like domain-containing protein [Phycisphaerae bacterium]